MAIPINSKGNISLAAAMSGAEAARSGSGAAPQRTQNQGSSIGSPPPQSNPSTPRAQAPRYAGLSPTVRLAQASVTRPTSKMPPTMLTSKVQLGNSAVPVIPVVKPPAPPAETSSPAGSELAKRMEYAEQMAAIATIEAEAAKALSDGSVTPEEHEKVRNALEAFRTDPEGFMAFAALRLASHNSMIDKVSNVANVAANEALHAEKHVNQLQGDLLRAGLADTGSFWENLGNNSVFINGRYFPIHIIFAMGVAEQSRRYFVGKKVQTNDLASIGKALWRADGNQEIAYQHHVAVYEAGEELKEGDLLPSDTLTIEAYPAVAGLPTLLTGKDLDATSPAGFSAYSYDADKGISFTVDTGYRVITRSVSRGVIASGWDATTWGGLVALIAFCSYSGKAGLAFFVLFPWLRNVLDSATGSHANTAAA